MTVFGQHACLVQLMPAHLSRKRKVAASSHQKFPRAPPYRLGDDSSSQGEYGYDSNCTVLKIRSQIICCNSPCESDSAGLNVVIDKSCDAAAS
mmetsp:Transcript_20722/g.34873  ORF Transcript_20722/g.34873 Transcript_20722/m.34873 type:complete len:93 (-) Transcript_20722:51-329(-)